MLKKIKDNKKKEMRRNVNNRIFIIVAGIILVLLFVFVPVSADTNGVGDFTDEHENNSYKAWANTGATSGAYQDESGYYIEIYCSDVLGGAGSDGADFTDKKSLHLMCSIYVTQFEDTLLGDDAIAYSELKSWLRGEVSGNDILTMFTEDIGIDTVLSWVKTDAEIDSFLKTGVIYFYRNKERTEDKKVIGASVPNLRSKVNWYIKVQPYVVFRGLGYEGSTMTYNYWGAFTCDELMLWQDSGGYNFLSYTCNNRISDGQTDFYISETGEPYNHVYLNSPATGYKLIQAYTYGEAVQSIAFSELPNSLYLEESWFGEVFMDYAPTKYWSSLEMRRYAGIGWASKEAQTGIKESFVELNASDGIDSVILDGYTSSNTITQIYEVPESEQFGDFNYSAVLSDDSYIKLWDENGDLITNRSGLYCCFYNDEDSFDITFGTDASGISVVPVASIEGDYDFYYSFESYENGDEPFASAYIVPEEAEWLGWYDEEDNLVFGGAQSGTATIPENGARYTAKASCNIIEVNSPARELPTLEISALTPNAEYTTGTEVISSFKVKNTSEADLYPDDNVTVTFNALDGAGEIIATVTSDPIALPAGEDTYVWFRWYVTADSGTSVTCTGEFDASGNANFDIESAEYSVNVTKTKKTSHTPEPQFEDTAPYKPFFVYAHKTVQRSNSWYDWSFDDATGEFVKNEYTAKLTGTLTEAADRNITYLLPKDSDGTPIMRSGYGVELVMSTAIEGTYTSDAVVMPQNGYFIFPEFSWHTGTGQYETAEKTDYGFTLPENPDAKNHRVHYTPLWFPDGEDIYYSIIHMSDCWTPAGMLESEVASNGLTIDGCLYDGYVITHPKQ